MYFLNVGDIFSVVVVNNPFSTKRCEVVVVIVLMVCREVVDTSSVGCYLAADTC